MAFPKPDITFYAAPSNKEAVFSILIPSWNNLPYLQLCIRSIMQNSTHPHQVIVHVNEGSDGTLAWVQQSGLAYTYSPQNAGVCYAMNAMAKLATTNYIVYMNDDMYACPAWDQPLLEAIQKRKDHLFYYSGTMIEFVDDNNQAVLAPYDFGRDIETFDEQGLLNFVKQKASKPDWFGACWPPSVVHKKLWDQVGGYSEAFSPGFYSDPDFAMKLWQAGVRDFKGIGNSFVYHFRCRSTGRVVANNGRRTFARKWGITSSFFYKHVLKVGKPFSPGVKLSFRRNLAYVAAKIKALYIALS